MQTERLNIGSRRSIPSPISAPEGKQKSPSRISSISNNLMRSDHANKAASGVIKSLESGSQQSKSTFKAKHERAMQMKDIISNEI